MIDGDRDLLRGLFFAFSMLVLFVLIGGTDPPPIAERKQLRLPVKQTSSAYVPTITRQQCRGENRGRKGSDQLRD